MASLDLTDTEVEILVAVLRNYLSELRSEIAHTDSREFREILKRRKSVLVKVITSLERSHPEPEREQGAT